MKVGILLILAIITAVHGFSYTETDPELLEYEQKWKDIQNKILTDGKWKEQWQKNVETFGHESLDPIPFDCDINIGSDVANTVHELGPRSIDVVAAFGDSLTAGHGLGAEEPLDIAIQNRGESWCIGGEGNLEAEGLTHPYITIPNALKKYNPNLYGFSISDGWWFEHDSGFNIAVAGARSRNMPQQAINMIDKMQDDPNVNFEQDWKLVTLFIGGNDLCAYCRSSSSMPQQYADTIEQALDTLHAQMPRALVNLVPMFDATPLPDLGVGNWLCELLQDRFCICATNSTYREQQRDIQLQYFNLLQALVDSGKYDTRDDFTVVFQPMWRDLVPARDPETGELDKSYFSPDCFHPGRKGHQVFAYQLYNTMFIPVGSKPMVYPETSTPKFACVTEARPYVFTRQNSQQSIDHKSAPKPYHREPFDYIKAGIKRLGFKFESGIQNEVSHVEHNKPADHDSGRMIGGIIGGCVAAIAIVALALGIVATWRRQKDEKKEDKKTLEMEQTERA